MASASKATAAGTETGGETPLSLRAVDRAAIESLYRAYLKPLTRYVARRFGAGPPDPEEVAQAAFARLAARSGISDIAQPERFLHTIACNIVLNHRQRALHREAVDRDIARADAESLSEASPEHVLLAREKLAIIEKTLAAMPAMRRRIFLMIRAEGLTPAEVARRFGIAEGAVHKHVSRGMKDCKAALNKARVEAGE